MRRKAERDDPNVPKGWKTYSLISWYDGTGDVECELKLWICQLNVRKWNRKGVCLKSQGGSKNIQEEKLFQNENYLETLVQPKLDTCSQFWSPGDQDSINRIEAVQRHFFSRIIPLNNMDFWEKLKMYSQERRRDRIWYYSYGKSPKVKSVDMMFSS